MYHEALKINNKEYALNALDDIIAEEVNILNKDSLSKYINCIKKIVSPEEFQSLLPQYHMRIFEAQSFSDQKDEAETQRGFSLFREKPEIGGITACQCEE